MGRRVRGRSSRLVLSLLALSAGAVLVAWTWRTAIPGPGAEGRAAPAAPAASQPRNPAAHRGATATPLFRPLRAAATQATATAPASVPVVMDPAAARAATVRGTLEIELPDGTRYPVRHERDETAADGNWTFVGRVDTPHGPLASVITFGPDAVFGTLPRPDGGTLKLTTRGGQSYLQEAGWSIPPGADPSRDLDYVLSDHEPRTATPAASGVHAAAAPSAPVAATSIASTDGPATITILAAYTANLVQLRGSDSAAQTEYRNLVAVMNQAHIDSGTRARFEIAGFAKVNYPAKATNEEARRDIINNKLPDGTNIHGLREQFAADLVTLIRPYVDGDLTCGISQFPGSSLDPYMLNRTTGFSVTAVESCAPLVYAHEIGHSLGLMHDRETVAGPHGGTLYYGAYPFSFGHRQVGPPGFATVMAYDSASRPWIGYFSHPGTQHCAGVACGDAALSDNVRSINLIASAIARFRDPPGTIAISDRWVRESDVFYAATIDVRLSSPAPAGGITFDLALEGGTAIEGQDFELWQGAKLKDIVIQPGWDHAALKLRILQDEEPEPTETVQVRLRNVRGGVTVLDDTATFGIVDDDTTVHIGGTLRFPPGTTPPATVGVRAREVKDGVSRYHDLTATAPLYHYALDVAEGAHVTLWTSTGGTLAMQERVIEHAAVAMHEVDLHLRNFSWVSGTLRTATGQPVTGVPLLLWNPDGDGSGYYVNWNQGYQGVFGRSVLTGVSMQLEVRDPPSPYVRQVMELPPVAGSASHAMQLRTVPSLTIPHATVLEGDAADGERTVLLTASLSVPRSQTGVSFDLQVGGTADAADYVLPATRITIPRFRSRVEVPIVIRGDDVPEPDETIELHISNISGAAWNPGPGSLRIVDDDLRTPGGSCRATSRPGVSLCD